MQKNYTKVSICKFDPSFLVLTEKEENAFQTFPEWIRFVDLQDEETIVRAYIQSLAKGLVKKVISNLMDIYKNDGLQNQNLSIILFMPGVVKLHYTECGDTTAKPWVYAHRHKKCYQVSGVFVQSKYWMQIQDAFIKEMDSFLGIDSFKFGKAAVTRARWAFCITE